MNITFGQLKALIASAGRRGLRDDTPVVIGLQNTVRDTPPFTAPVDGAYETIQGGTQFVLFTRRLP